jgi:DNA-binding NarL/FixJ family response regulator
VLQAKIRVVIVEDSEIFRRGLCAQFDTDPMIEVVAQFASAFEAVQAVAELRPSVILMDLRLPWLPDDSPTYCGANAIRQILQRLPEAAIAVITGFMDKELVREALQAGARTFVLKEALAEDLLDAVHRTAEGAGILSPAIADVLPHIIAGPHQNGTLLFHQLTKRENEILRLYAEDNSVVDIARKLDISRKTVENRLSDIPGKLGVTTRKEAAELARAARNTSDDEHPDGPAHAG